MSMPILDGNRAVERRSRAWRGGGRRDGSPAWTGSIQFQPCMWLPGGNAAAQLPGQRT